MRNVEGTDTWPLDQESDGGLGRGNLTNGPNRDERMQSRGEQSQQSGIKE